MLGIGGAPCSYSARTVPARVSVSLSRASAGLRLRFELPGYRVSGRRGRTAVGTGCGLVGSRAEYAFFRSPCRFSEVRLVSSSGFGFVASCGSGAARSSSASASISGSTSDLASEALGHRAFSERFGRFRAGAFGLLARAGFLGMAGGAGLATLLVPGSARAALCVIDAPDPSGCARHDDMLYRSKEVIPDEAYVDFVARYCNFENRIVRTKHAVACVYYGKKALYQGAEAKKERNYNGIYAPLLVDSAGWTRDANGLFWRVVETAGREVLRPGDVVRRLERPCEHDDDGKEALAKDFVAVGDAKPIATDDVLFSVTKEVWDGMVLEVVGSAKHAFVRVEMVKKVERDATGGKAAAP